MTFYLHINITTEYKAYEFDLPVIQNILARAQENRTLTTDTLKNRLKQISPVLHKYSSFL